ALTGVLGIGEGHLFHHRKARRLVSGDFAKSGSLFQDFLSRDSTNRQSVQLRFILLRTVEHGPDVL
ncbi:hypothetical protein, partial [Pseudomonas shirazica]|uniref:hypothetical protein n=1 Tax=Pseudomonas shirazica TaxID=1940636 RepID=UPI003AAF86F6